MAQRRAPPKLTCGAKSKSTGKPCMRPAGWGTSNTTGRCKFHGGATPIRHGRYSTITRPRIRELLDEFENDPTPLDLLPEVKLLRALIADFVERWDHYTDLTFRWHALYSSEYRQAVDEWREAVVTLLEDGGYENVTPDGLPPVPDPRAYAPEKPRQLLDVTAAAGMLDKVGNLVDRIERHKREGAITLETLDRVLEQLGVEVVQAAKEAVQSDVERAALLAAIERRWASIRLDPTTPRAGPTQSARSLPN